MFLLIDHNKKIVTDYENQNYVFDTVNDAQDFADNRDEPDWLIVKFIDFT